jgi:branched-chain amino acid transport system substrate-binding protein
MIGETMRSSLLSLCRFALGLLAICAIASTSAARSADAAPFEINAIASLTGPGAFLGKAQQDSLTRLEATVNRQGGIHGRPIHFVVYDDQTNPQVAVQITNDLIAHKATVVIGPTLTAPCLAVMPLVQGKMLQYCLSPGIHPAKNSFTFSANASTTDLVKAFVRYFRGRHLLRIAALLPSDATGQDAERNLAAVLALPENKDIKLVAREFMTPGDITVAAQIAKIKAAAPQALIAWTIGSPTGTVLHGINDAGLDVPLALSNANMTFAAMKQWTGFMPTDVYFPGVPFLAGITTSAQSKVALQTFFEATRDQGLTPDFQTGNVWDPAVLLISAFRALGTDATPARIRDYLEQLHDFAGISGVYDFRDGSQRGLSQKDVVIMRWDAAKNNWIAVSELGGAPSGRQ